MKNLPAVQGLEDEIERLSRNCFYKIHVRKLQLDKIQSLGKMVVHNG